MNLGIRNPKIQNPGEPSPCRLLESIDDPRSSAKLALGSAVTGTGSPIQVVDPNALNAAPGRFYRLVLFPQ